MLPQIKWLNTTRLYYLYLYWFPWVRDSCTVWLESSMSWPPKTTKWEMGAVVSSEAGLGQAAFPGARACWQNSFPFSPLD